MKKWETKNGDEIPYKKIKDDHLLNILKWIKKRAKDGVMECVSFGYCGDDDFMTGDCWEISGKEVLEKYDYNGLLKEAKKRRLF